METAYRTIKGRTHKILNSLFKNHQKGNFKMPEVEKKEELDRKKVMKLKET